MCIRDRRRVHGGYRLLNLKKMSLESKTTDENRYLQLVEGLEALNGSYRQRIYDLEIEEKRLLSELAASKGLIALLEYQLEEKKIAYCQFNQNELARMAEKLTYKEMSGLNKPVWKNESQELSDVNLDSVFIDHISKEVRIDEISEMVDYFTSVSYTHLTLPTIYSV
eukprot:TRINITY_DN5112_c0_g1_i2.p1 TRINITY_DN5112_c0_g1~~TRINITY_DN5112_c0_g1_i2.p1  ORF type:complete len:187 (-),score=34.47 TRINITY_DN5112_c0_g1_i2:34-534(-)